MLLPTVNKGFLLSEQGWFLSPGLLEPTIITILSHELASAMPSVTIERCNCPMSETVNTQVPNDHV